MATKPINMLRVFLKPWWAKVFVLMVMLALVVGWCGVYIYLGYEREQPIIRNLRFSGTFTRGVTEQVNLLPTWLELFPEVYQYGERVKAYQVGVVIPKPLRELEYLETLHMMMLPSGWIPDIAKLHLKNLRVEFFTLKLTPETARQIAALNLERLDVGVELIKFSQYCDKGYFSGIRFGEVEFKSVSRYQINNVNLKALNSFDAIDSITLQVRWPFTSSYVAKVAEIQRIKEISIFNPSYSGTKRSHIVTRDTLVYSQPVDIDFTQFKDLKVLRISDFLLTDRSIQSISRCSGLERLVLNNTEVNDGDLAVIAGSKSIHKVEISRENSTATGHALITAMLKKNER